MADDFGDGSAGGGSGPTPPKFSDYVNPDARSLWGKIDFRSMISDGSRAIAAMLSLTFAAVTVGFGKAFNLVVNSIESFYVMVYSAVFGTPAELQATAVETAGEEIEMFGLFALPVAATVGLLSLLAVLAAIYIFTGRDWI